MLSILAFSPLWTIFDVLLRVVVMLAAITTIPVPNANVFYVRLYFWLCLCLSVSCCLWLMLDFWALLAIARWGNRVVVFGQFVMPMRVFMYLRKCVWLCVCVCVSLNLFLFLLLVKTSVSLVLVHLLDVKLYNGKIRKKKLIYMEWML